MNIMKKWLCFMLALCMLAIPVCNATDTVNATEASSEVSVTEFTDIDYSTILGKSIDTLVEKSIITGFPDGTYKADQTLTRAEFAKIIVCFLGSTTESSQDSGFPDVDNVGGSAHWAKPYIKIAKDMKIISGFPDGTFIPDAPVTYEQAVKMIMCALGFTNLSYPDGYIQLAMQKKLFANSPHTAGQSAAITRGTTAIFINNALSITPNNKTTDNTNATFTGISFGSSSGGGGGGGGGGGSSSASRKITGIVWGTETTMLDTTKSILYSEELAICYENKDGETVREDLPVATKYRKKIDSYLGKHIKATIKEDDDGKEYISEITLVEKKNRIVSVDLEDFISMTTSDETGETTVTYYDSDEKKQTLALAAPENLYIIYNDKSINMDSAENYEYDPSFITDTKIGSFKFYSNDGDKTYDVIFVESYKTSVINGKNASSGTIKLKYGEDDLNVLYSDEENKIDRTITTLKNSSTNETMTLSSIREYDVIDYKESIDKDFITAEVTPAETSAVIGSFIKFSEVDGTRKIQIRNSSTDKKVEYKLNYNFIDYLDNYSGKDKFIPQEYDNVKLYFNADGKVAAMEEIISIANSKYGYITELAYKDADGSKEDYLDPSETPEEGDKVAIKLYQIDPSKSTIGSHTTNPILVDSTVRVDGIIIKNNPEEVMTRLLTAAELSNAGKEAPLNKNTAHSSLIRYELSDGQIITIDTVLDPDGETLSTKSDERFNTLFRSSTFIYEDDAADNGKHVYHSSSSSPGFYKASATSLSRVKLYNNSSKSTLIFIPGDRSDKKYYSASKFINTNFYEGMKYYIEAYNVNGGYAEFLLQFISDGKDVVTSFSTMAVVTATDDENSEDPDELKIKYRTAASTSENTITISKGSPAAEKYDALNVGDVILFSTALDKTMYDFFHALDITDLPDKRVDNADLFYCDSEHSDRRINGFDIFPNDTQNIKLNAEYRTIYGTAVSYENTGTGTLVVNPMLHTDYFDEMDEQYNEEHTFSSSVRLFVYDEEEEKVTMYTSASTSKNYLKENLFTKDKYGFKDADKVFIYTSNNYSSISSGEPVVKFVYLIRMKSQADPDNYEGVETPESDPLEAEKTEAISELEAYIEAINKTKYTLKQSLFATIFANGKKTINEAITEDDISAALSDAKAMVDDVPEDSDFEDAKSEIESYVDIAKYRDAEAIVSEEIEKVEDIDSKAELIDFIASTFSKIDDAVLTQVIEDKKAELDEYLNEIAEDNGYDFTEDTELSDNIEELKTTFDEAESISKLEEAYSTATTAIDEYVAANYPKDSGESSGNNSGDSPGESLGEITDPGETE